MKHIIYSLLAAMLLVVFSCFQESPESLPGDTGGAAFNTGFETHQIRFLPEEERVTVNIAGDVLLARGPGEQLREQGISFAFELVLPELLDADISFCNLESPVAFQGVQGREKPEYITMRAAPGTLLALVESGFDVVSLANNHMTDYGPAALLETRENLDVLGITHTGAGSSLETACAPALLTRENISFAFLAFAEEIWAVRAADTDTPGIAPYNAELIENQIRSVITEYNPDYLFVSLHWGYEFDYFPAEYQMRDARQFIDAGADVIIGHHPHVLQGIELYNNGIIFYSLGNFLFDMDDWPQTRDSAMFRLTVAPRRLETLEVIPISVIPGEFRPSIAEGEALSRIRTALIERSQQFGTEIMETEEGIFIPLH
ncbi:MAG: CapA family protein [Spirochaetia bacterium]